MKEFNELVEVMECLLGPNGCPWDKEQTLSSMRACLLEETSEVIEAVNLNANEKIEEELGDLFFNVLFMCRLAQKEGRFTIAAALRHIITKLIRRHPHIFGDAKIENSEQVLQQWEEIKKTEHKPDSLLDNIPKELPALTRALKIYKKMKKVKYVLSSQSDETGLNEENFGRALFQMVQKGNEQGFDSEQALRAFLTHEESRFRSWEGNRLDKEF